MSALGEFKTESELTSIRVISQLSERVAVFGITPLEGTRIPQRARAIRASSNRLRPEIAVALFENIEREGGVTAFMLAATRIMRIERA